MILSAMLIDGGGVPVDSTATTAALPTPPTVDTTTLAGILAASTSSSSSQFGSSTPWAQAVGNSIYTPTASASGMGGPKDISNYINTSSLTSGTIDPGVTSPSVTTSGDPSSVVDYKDVTNYDASLANIAAVGAAMRDAGLNTAGHVQKYTTPITVPGFQNSQPLNADDPRNSKAFREKYGRYPSKADYQAFMGKTVSDIGKPTTTLPDHQNWMWLPSTGWKAVWEAGYGPGAWGSSLQNISSNNSNSSTTSAGSSNANLIAAASDVVTSADSITTVASANGGAASIEDSTSFVSNNSDTPNIPDVIPAPVYALDSPENLYIDPNSFTPIVQTESVYIGGSATPSTFSSTTYSVDLKFNAVPGAVKYNYRLSATI